MVTVLVAGTATGTALAGCGGGGGGGGPTNSSTTTGTSGSSSGSTNTPQFFGPRPPASSDHQLTATTATTVGNLLAGNGIVVATTPTAHGNRVFRVNGVDDDAGSAAPTAAWQFWVVIGTRTYFFSNDWMSGLPLDFPLATGDRLILARTQLFSYTP